MRDQQHRTSTRVMRALRRQPRPLRLSGAVNAVTPCRNDQGILQCWGWQQRRRLQAVSCCTGFKRPVLCTHPPVSRPYIVLDIRACLGKVDT